jgi:hypothetical protein
MFGKAREIAHLSVAIFVLGFVFLGAYVTFKLMWAIIPAGILLLFGALLGVVTLVKNKRFFPNTAAITGRDEEHLDIIGYIEAYVSILPALLLIFYFFYFIV